MAQVIPLDQDTWAMVYSAAVRACAEGLDVAEELNRKGVVLSPRVRLRIQEEILGVLVETLRSWRPNEMIRRRYDPSHSTTPAEMYEIMIDYIEDYRNALKGA